MITRSVLVLALDQNENPVEGAIVTSVLDRTDTDSETGEKITPVQETRLTDENGLVTLYLWPNERGAEQDSRYRVTGLTPQGRTLFDVWAYVPDVNGSVLGDISEPVDPDLIWKPVSGGVQSGEVQTMIYVALDQHNADPGANGPAIGQGIDGHKQEADPHPQYATGGALDQHSGRIDNPHGVTAAQAGADPQGSADAALQSALAALDQHNDEPDANVPAILKWANIQPRAWDGWATLAPYHQTFSQLPDNETVALPSEGPFSGFTAYIRSGAGCTLTATGATDVVGFDLGPMAAGQLLKLVYLELDKWLVASLSPELPVQAHNNNPDAHSYLARNYVTPLQLNGDLTLNSTLHRRTLYVTAATGAVLTLDDSLPAGFVCGVVALTDDPVQTAKGALTLEGPDGDANYKIAGRGTYMAIEKLANGLWAVAGNVEVV